MAYNCFGDLRKREMVLRLRERGCNVQNVHELNLIMERMGLLIHSGNRWLTDREAVKYTIYNCQVFDADVWHPEVLDEIYKFLKD